MYLHVSTPYVSLSLRVCVCLSLYIYVCEGGGLGLTLFVEISSYILDSRTKITMGRAVASSSSSSSNDNSNYHIPAAAALSSSTSSFPPLKRDLTTDLKLGLSISASPSDQQQSIHNLPRYIHLYLFMFI